MNNGWLGGFRSPAFLLVDSVRNDFLYVMADSLFFRWVGMSPHRPNGVLEEVIRRFNTPAYTINATKWEGV